MNPNDIVSISAEDVPAGVDDSLKKTGGSFTEEKNASQKKKTETDISGSPAPFYDELHFANYE